MSVVEGSSALSKDGNKIRDDRRSDMKQPLAHAARPLSSMYPALGQAWPILVDPSRHSQQNLAPTVKRAVVTDQYVGRNLAPNLREEIAEWLIVVALFVVAALVTMEPFMLL
jgi:hypothetical protein